MNSNNDEKPACLTDSFLGRNCSELVTTPLVSGIIITHNRIHLVERAVESVLKQTYPNIELIVVDDGSVDGTRELMESKAAEKGFTYIRIAPEDSKGGNYARNLGAKKAKGEFLAFLDDDDEWLPEKTEKQVEVFLKNPECGAVGCLKVVEYDFQERSLEPESNIIRGDASKVIFTRIPFMTSATMIKRRVFFECGMFDENLRFWQEYELSIRYCQITEVDYVAEHLCLYRVNNSDNNRLTNKLEGWRDAVRYIDKKHRGLIDALPLEYSKQHKMLIAEDGLYRASKVGNTKRQKAYLLTAFCLDPSFSRFKRFLLSFETVKSINDIRKKRRKTFE